MIGELPESRGYNAIMIAVDQLSKRIHAIPTVTALDSAGVAQLFLEHVWRHHGLPEVVISDWGPAFISCFSTKLANLLQITLNPSTAYHPQTDSQTKRVNQEIEAYLQVFIGHCQDDWADWLPLAEFSYNNCIHSSTCQTPFELNMGQHPQLGIEPICTSSVEAADTFVSWMHQMQEEAKAALQHAADTMKLYYDQNHCAAPKYQLGDWVWLNMHNYTTDHPTKKLDHKWAGPYQIEKIVSPAAIKLKLSG